MGDIVTLGEIIERSQGIIKNEKIDPISNIKEGFIKLVESIIRSNTLEQYNPDIEGCEIVDYPIRSIKIPKQILINILEDFDEIIKESIIVAKFESLNQNDETKILVNKLGINYKHDNIYDFMANIIKDKGVDLDLEDINELEEYLQFLIHRFRGMIKFSISKYGSFYLKDSSGYFH